MSEAVEAVPSEGRLPDGLETDAAPSSELLEVLRRERADFINYKRRVERERAEDRERARLDLLRELLPLLDDLDRAMEQVPADLADHPWAQGVALSHRQVGETLRRLGLERVGTEGDPFDPAVHEAVTYNAQPDGAEPSVVRVLRPGYRVCGQLLRPAQVVVGGPARQDTGEQAPPRGSQHRSRTRSSSGG